MNHFILVFCSAVLLIGGASLVWLAFANEHTRFSDTEAGFENAPVSEHVEGAEGVIIDPNTILDSLGTGRYSRWGWYWREFSPEEEALYGNFERPEGPLRVGLQVGHWKNSEVPEELDGLRRNGGGAQGGGKSEVDVVHVIAKRAKSLLEAEGIIVDLLPATLPVDYYADAFVSVHADGNGSPDVSGFKISGPRRDFSGKADMLIDALYASYEAATGLSLDPNVTRRMSSYYAFNWRRYDHALHPMTPAVILETGFLTSPRDRSIIVSDPGQAAAGIANGVLNFLRGEG